MTGSSARDHLRHCAATGQWDAAAADTLMASLPEPDQLLTKDHLDLRLRAEFAELRHEMRTEIGDLRHEMRTELTGVRTEMHTEIAGLRDEMRTELTGMRTEISDLRDEMRHRNVELGGELRLMMIEQTKWLVATLLASIFAFGTLLVTATAVLS